MIVINKIIIETIIDKIKSSSYSSRSNLITKLNKKNPIIKNLFSKKFKPKIVKAKKGKGSYVRKKDSRVKSFDV